MKFENLIPIQWNSYGKPVPYNPEYPFLTLDGNMDRFFNHLSTDFFDFRTIPEQENYPKVDVTETTNELLVSAELPGMDGKDISVTLDDGALTLKGDKKMEKENEQGESYSRERSYGSFQRSFKVTEMIDQDKIDASFNKGVLMIKLPKTLESKKEVKNIPINY